MCPLLEKYGTFIERCNALIEKVSPCVSPEMWPLLESTLAERVQSQGGLVVVLYLNDRGLKLLWPYLRDAMLAAPAGKVRLLSYVYDFDTSKEPMVEAEGSPQKTGVVIVSKVGTMHCAVPGLKFGIPASV
eukprot:SAG31_NODE_467_length_15267_cov_13.792919_13_plen_131_part_00